MVLDDFLKDFWETYNHLYDWTNFHYQAWEEGIEIKGIPSFNDRGEINGLFFFDPKQDIYRKDLAERFKEIKNGPDNPSRLASICFSLRHPVMQLVTINYITNEMWKKS